MPRRPYIILAIACLLIGLATVVVWIDSASHFTTARTPTIHSKFLTVVISQGTALLMEGASRPHGFHWTRREQLGASFLRTRTEIAGFGVGRSIDGTYVMFPLSVIPVLSLGAAFFFWRIRRVPTSPGFSVVQDSNKKACG